MTSKYIDFDILKEFLTYFKILKLLYFKEKVKVTKTHQKNPNLNF